MLYSDVNESHDDIAIDISYGRHSLINRAFLYHLILQKQCKSIRKLEILSILRGIKT